MVLYTTPLLRSMHAIFKTLPCCQSHLDQHVGDAGHPTALDKTLHTFSKQATQPVARSQVVVRLNQYTQTFVDSMLQRHSCSATYAGCMHSTPQNTNVLFVQVVGDANSTVRRVNFTVHCLFDMHIVHVG